MHTGIEEEEYNGFIINIGITKVKRAIKKLLITVYMYKVAYACIWYNAFCCIKVSFVTES